MVRKQSNKNFQTHWRVKSVMLTFWKNKPYGENVTSSNQQASKLQASSKQARCKQEVSKQAASKQQASSNKQAQIKTYTTIRLIGDRIFISIGINKALLTCHID